MGYVGDAYHLIILRTQFTFFHTIFHVLSLMPLPPASLIFQSTGIDYNVVNCKLCDDTKKSFILKKKKHYTSTLQGRQRGMGLELLHPPLPINNFSLKFFFKKLPLGA